MSITSSQPLAGAAIISEAETWLGVPYTYGGGRGTSASARLNGVDCSGFVYQVFTALGIDPGTDTVSQFNNPAAVTVPTLAQAQPGDLVFFGSPVGGTQEHVGIYLGNGYMIDAPHTGSSVRIDQVAGFENLLGIKRLTQVLPATAALSGQPQASAALASSSSSTSSASSSLTGLFSSVVGIGLALALVGLGILLLAKPKTSPEPSS